MDLVEKETICKQIGDMKEQTEFMRKFRLAMGSALNEIQNLRAEISVLKQENYNFKNGEVEMNTPVMQRKNHLSGCHEIETYYVKGEIESQPNLTTDEEKLKPKYVLETNEATLQKSERTLSKLASHIKVRNERVKVMSQRLTSSNKTLLKREKKLEEKLRLIEDYKKYTSQLENEMSRSALMNNDVVGKLQSEQQRSLSKDAEIRYLKKQVQYLKHEADKMYYKLRDRENHPLTCSNCKVIIQNSNDASTYNSPLKNYPANYRKGNKFHGRISAMKGIRNIPILSPISEEQVSSTQQWEQDNKAAANKPFAPEHKENGDSASDSPKEGSFAYFNVGKPHPRTPSPKNAMESNDYSPSQQTIHPQSSVLWGSTEPKDSPIHRPRETRHHQVYSSFQQNSPVKYNPIPNDCPTVSNTAPIPKRVQANTIPKSSDDLAKAPSVNLFPPVSPNNESILVNTATKLSKPAQKLSAVPRNLASQNDGTSSDTSISSCSSSKSGRKISKKRKKSAKYITFYDHRIDVTQFTMNDFKDIMWGISAAGIAPGDFLRFLAEHTARLNNDAMWSGRHSLGKPGDWLSLEDCY